MKEKRETVILAPCCVIVKGRNNSCIYDLQRNGIYRFPNKFLSVFEDADNMGIWKISTDNSSSQEKFFVDELQKNQLCIVTSQDCFFRPLSTEHHTERVCENAIIDRGADSSYSMKSLAEKLSIVSCAAVSLRYFYPVKLDFMEPDIMAFADSTVRSIEIHCNCLDELNSLDFKEFKKRNGRVCSFVLYSEKESKVFNVGSDLSVHLKKFPMNACNMCGCVSETKMRAQTQLYTESKNHNNCLYRKIYIGKQGEIKNCPEMPTCYGLLDDCALQLKNILNSPEFRKYWSLTKDMVDECQDCEFRYACLDCRCFLHEPENIYSKPLKCSYKP